MKTLITKIGLNASEKLGCIEIIIGDNEYNYNLVILEKSNEILSIQTYKNDIKSLAQLHAEIPKNFPIVLSVTGKGIIFKKLKTEKYQNDLEILNDVLPNASLKEFDLKTNSIDEDYFYAIVIRKQLIDKILKSFSDLYNFILDITYGPFDIQNIVQYLKPELSEINTATYQLSVSNDKIEAATPWQSDTDFYYNIGEESINNKSLIAYSVGFSYLVLKRNRQSSSALINNSVKEYQSYKIYRKLTIAMLAFLFISLLINYFIFDNYNSKYNNISSKLSDYQGLITSFSNKQKELVEKKEIIAKTGLTDVSRISYYADQIAMNLPDGISFTKMEIFPLTKKSNRNKEFEFIGDELVLTGLAKNSVVLNEWVKIIKDSHWINEISNFTFTKEHKEGNQFSKFNLKLKLL